MGGAVLLGIDVGTTQTKVGAFDLQGRVAATASRATPVTRLGPERAEHDAEAIWQAVREGIRAVLGRLGGEAPVLAVGVSSFGESGVLLGSGGRPLAPVPAWYDDRTFELFRAWEARSDVAAVRRVSGLRPDPTYGVFKLARLAGTAPEAVARAAAWLPVADWIAYRLTGRVQTSPSQAARTLAYDLRVGTWNEALLGSLELDRSLLPPIRAAGDPVGRVSAAAAEATGLPRDTVVGDSGHDQVMAAMGAGGRPGTIVNACGTAETLMAFVGRDALDRALGDAPGAGDVAVGPHAQAGRYYLMATVRAAGSVVDWSVRTLAGGPPADRAATGAALADAENAGGPPDTLAPASGTPDTAASTGGEADHRGGPGSAYEVAARAAAASPAGSNGVWFIPHLRAAPAGSRLRSLAAGHFGGLRETTTPGDMLRAVLEGVSLESGRHLELLRRLTGPGGARRVVATGGPTRNALWMQIKADVFGVPIEVAASVEGALWGAALAGGRAAGVVPADATPPVHAAPPVVPSADAERYRAMAGAYLRRIAGLAGSGADEAGP